MNSNLPDERDVDGRLKFEMDIRNITATHERNKRRIKHVYWGMIILIFAAVFGPVIASFLFSHP